MKNILTFKITTNIRGTLLNIATTVYFAVLSPLIARYIYDAVNANGTNTSTITYAIATGLILIAILETYALPKKMRYIHQFIHSKNYDESTPVVLWFFHLVLTVISMFAIFALIGLDISNLQNNMWIAFVIMAVFIKEIYILIAIIGGDSDDKECMRKLKIQYSRPNKKEWKIDLILTISAWGMYSVTWGSIAYNVEMYKNNIVAYIGSLLGAAFISLLFYAPLRIPYFIEGSIKKTYAAKFRYAASSILVVVTAVLSL